MNLFNRTVRQALESEWRKLPPNEIGCIDQRLRQRGASIRMLIQLGVMPSDRRVNQVRASCRQPMQPVLMPQVRYIVDGLALGDNVNFGSPVYLQYQCNPSEQFPGFIWCQNRRQDKARTGTVMSGNSILHSDDGTAVYINRYIEPVTFGSGEIEHEIDRLSAKYGERARVIRMPSKLGLERDGVIALWGQILLEPLDSDILSIIGSGKDVSSGLRIDFLADFQKSAKLGLPVYRIAGGAGYLWSASFDPNGRGHLRFLTSNATAYDAVAGFEKYIPDAAAKEEMEVKRQDFERDSHEAKERAGQEPIAKLAADASSSGGASNAEDHITNASRSSGDVNSANATTTVVQLSITYLTAIAMFFIVFVAISALLRDNMRKTVEWARRRHQERNLGNDEKQWNDSKVDNDLDHGLQEKRWHDTSDYRLYHGRQHKAWYEVLGVPVDASAEKINMAYHERVKKNHPDRVADLDPEFKSLANERTKGLNAARDQGLGRRR